MLPTAQTGDVIRNVVSCVPIVRAWWRIPRYRRVEMSTDCVRVHPHTTAQLFTALAGTFKVATCWLLHCSILVPSSSRLSRESYLSTSKISKAVLQSRSRRESFRHTLFSSHHGQLQPGGKHILYTDIFVKSSPRSSSPTNTPGSTGSSTGRPTSPAPPGGARTVIRRRAAAERQDKVANARPASTRSAGAGGSTSTMLSKTRSLWSS